MKSTRSGTTIQVNDGCFREKVEWTNKLENEMKLSDVIGRVVIIGETILGEKNGKPNRRISAILYDIEGLNVSCTPLEAYKHDFNTKLNNSTGMGKYGLH